MASHVLSSSSCFRSSFIDRFIYPRSKCASPQCNVELASVKLKEPCHPIGRDTSTWQAAKLIVLHLSHCDCGSVDSLSASINIESGTMHVENLLDISCRYSSHVRLAAKVHLESDSWPAGLTGR